MAKTATERLNQIWQEFPLIGAQYIKMCREAGLSDEEIVARMRDVMKEIEQKLRGDQQ